MSLSLTKQLIKNPATINSLAAVNCAFNAKRNFSLNVPKKFLFCKKPAKVEVEKVNMSNWKFGTPQKIPSGNVKSYEQNEIKNWLGLLLGTMPNSSCLVSTVSEEGIDNTAPFALVSCICSNPPVISVTVGRTPDGKIKDTQANIDATKEFGVSVISEWFLESSSAAGAPLPHNVSEFDKIGITRLPSSVIKAPLVAQSAVNFECKLISRQQFKDKDGNETSVVYNGEVVKAHINEEVFNNETGKIDYDKFKLLSCLSGFKYNRVNSIFETVSK